MLYKPITLYCNTNFLLNSAIVLFVLGTNIYIVPIFICLLVQADAVTSLFRPLMTLFNNTAIAADSGEKSKQMSCFGMGLIKCALNIVANYNVP